MDQQTIINYISKNNILPYNILRQTLSQYLENRNNYIKKNRIIISLICMIFYAIIGGFLITILSLIIIGNSLLIIPFIIIGFIMSGIIGGIFTYLISSFLNPLTTHSLLKNNLNNIDLEITCKDEQIISDYLSQDWYNIINIYLPQNYCNGIPYDDITFIKYNNIYYMISGKFILNNLHELYMIMELQYKNINL